MKEKCQGRTKAIEDNICSGASLPTKVLHALVWNLTLDVVVPNQRLSLSHGTGSNLERFSLQRTSMT